MRHIRHALLALVVAALCVSTPADVAQGQTTTREMLNGPRTYYVRSDGDDTNSCLIDSPVGPTGACRTWQRAIGLASRIDYGGYTVTIQHGNESSPVTFTEHIAISTQTGGGVLALRGSPTPGNTVIRSNGGETLGFRSVVTPVYLWDMTLQDGAFLVMASWDSRVHIKDGVIFGPAGFAHIFVHDSQAVVLNVGSTNKIAGDALYHVLVNGGSAFLEYSTVTLAGSPDFYAYAMVMGGGRIQAVGTTWTGQATGYRYLAVANGVIETQSSGQTYLPGNQPGLTADGGVYR